MRKLFFYFFCLSCLLQPFYSMVAQTPLSPATQLKEEQKKLLHNINIISIDSAIVRRLTPFIQSQIDSIRLFIYADKALPAAGKRKSRTEPLYFFK
jgi:hypothetical protein